MTRREIIMPILFAADSVKNGMPFFSRLILNNSMCIIESIKPANNIGNKSVEKSRPKRNKIVVAISDETVKTILLIPYERTPVIIDRRTSVFVCKVITTI